MVTAEEKRELEKIKKENNHPRDEEKTVPVIKNGNQLKVAIPKKFSDILKINSNQKAKFTLLKKEKKLIMEII